MEAEDFLALSDQLDRLFTSTRPMLEMLRRARMSFIEDVGMSEDAADLMTVEWFKAMVVPVIAGIKDESHG